MTSNKNKLYQIQAAIRDYELATGVKCYLLDDRGKGIGERNCYQCHHICEYIQQFDSTGICTRDYLESCSSTLKTETAQTYQCPLGLMNIAVPIFPDDETVYFVSSGPILAAPPDKVVVNTFLKFNRLPQSQAKDINGLLEEVPLLDGDKIQALGNTLQRSVCTVNSSYLIHNCHKKDELTILRQELRQEFRFSFHTEFLVIAQTFQKELDLLSEQNGQKTRPWQKALEAILLSFVKEVFKYNSFEETRHRAALFFLVLSQVAEKRDMNQKSIFGITYENIKKLLSATSFTNLNSVIYNTVDCFQQAFFQKNKSQSNDLVLKAMSYIRRNYMDISLNDVAEAVALNPSYLSYLFSKSSGQSYSQYLNKVRVEASKHPLREGLSIAQIAQNCGFSDQSYYIKVFKRFEGISPAKWKKNLEAQF